MSASPRVLPSPVYVFVVLSLAAFLALFTVVRKQGLVYETSIAYSVNVANPDQLPTELVDALRVQAESKMTTPEFVLDSMRHAEIVAANCESTPEALEIAQGIADRMRFRSIPIENQASRTAASARRELVLVTERPKAGIRLLDSMLADLARSSKHEIASFPATIIHQHGGSVSPTGLLMLIVSSGMVGFLGLMLHESSKQTPVLYTNDDVTEIAGVPVVADFVEDQTFPDREAIMVRRRAFRFAVRTAELVIAAVFLVMICNLFVRDALMTRFVSNPLAAYGEVLASLTG